MSVNHEFGNKRAHKAISILYTPVFLFSYLLSILFFEYIPGKSAPKIGGIIYDIERRIEREISLVVCVEEERNDINIKYKQPLLIDKWRTVHTTRKSSLETIELKENFLYCRLELTSKIPTYSPDDKVIIEYSSIYIRKRIAKEMMDTIDRLMVASKI